MTVMLYNCAMKIIQTNDTLEINNSGYGTIVGALVFIVLGLAMAYFIGTSKVTSQNITGSPKTWTFVGIFFAAMGVLIAFSARSKNVSLQKNGNCTSITKRLIGGKSEEQTFLSQDIKCVSLSTYLDYSNSNNSSNQGSPRKKSKLSLILKNNDELELANEAKKGLFTINGMSLSNIQKAPLIKEAEQISGFLGVPLQSNHDGAPSLGDVVSILKGEDPNVVNEKLSTDTTGIPNKQDSSPRT